MKLNPGTGATPDLSLRVSVATYDKVLFPHPQNGTWMLALERKATIREDGSFHVRAQPFGGGVRILNPTPLQELIGEIKYDSERSRHEQDFRILIPPSKWELVKEYCLHHLEDQDDSELEASPDRELVEEFEETLNVQLKPDQYTVQPLGFVVENHPVWTENWYALGYLTVRVYRTFRVDLVDPTLCQTILAASQRYSDQDLGMAALKDSQNGGRGRANSALTLPLHLVTEAYLTLQAQRRYGKIIVEGHELDESVLAVLEEIDLPQYQRMT
jgi:hypothetical protein